MRIAQYRSAFTCCLLDIEPDQAQSIRQIMQAAGFGISDIDAFDLLKEKVVESPPHFVVIQASDEPELFRSKVEWLTATLPETQIFILGSREETTERAVAFGDAIFDQIEWPLTHPRVLLRAFDRAAELNFYFYQNEQLHARLQPVEMKEVQVQTDSTLERLLEKLQEVSDRDKAFAVLMGEVQQSWPELQIIFFKYYPPRRTLMALKWAGIEDSQCQGVGINFNEHSASIKIKDLRQPEGVTLLREMAETVFGCSDFIWVPLEILGEVQGLWLILNPGDHVQFKTKWKPLNDVFSLILEKIDLTQRFHLINHLDLSTLLLGRTKLIQKVNEEVSRSRRLEWPVSLLILSIDNAESFRSRLGEEELELVLKMCARILQKQSRVNDLLGRVGPDEIAVLLPHTDLQGAAKKADRVRALIERADFSKVVQNAGRLTVSIGVSEYPSCCSDAEELYQSADLALYQVKQSTKNAVCLSSPPDGFKPDFIFGAVKSKGG